MPAMALQKRMRRAGHRSLRRHIIKRFNMPSLRQYAMIPLFLTMPLAINSIALLSLPLNFAFSVTRTLVTNPLSKMLTWRKAKLLAPLIKERDFKVVVIGEFFLIIVSQGEKGGGFSGINCAYELKRLGIPFVVFEKSARVGGTWYPFFNSKKPALCFKY